MRVAGAKLSQANPGVVSYHDLQDLVDTVKEIRQLCKPYIVLCTPRMAWMLLLVWCFWTPLVPLAIAGVVSASHLTPQHEDGSETAPEPQADVGKDTSDDNDSDRVMDDFVDVLGATCHIVASTFSIVVSIERLRRNTDPSMSHRVVGWLLLSSVVLSVASIKAIICVAAVVSELNHWNDDWISLLTLTAVTKSDHQNRLVTDLYTNQDSTIKKVSNESTSVRDTITIFNDTTSAEGNFYDAEMSEDLQADSSPPDRQPRASVDDMYALSVSPQTDPAPRARSASFSNDIDHQAAPADVDSRVQSGDGGQWIVLTDATLGIPKPVQRPRSESSLSPSSIAGAIANATVRRRALARAKCTTCNVAIDTIFRRRVMCRHCGFPFCGNCCAAKVPRVMFGATSPAARKETVRVCNSCKDYLKSDTQAREWAGLEDGYFTPESASAAATGMFI